CMVDYPSFGEGGGGSIPGSKPRLESCLKNTTRAAGWYFFQQAEVLGLLGVSTEVVVVSHATVVVGVHVPRQRARGELALRLFDLLEHGVGFALLGDDLVPHDQLLLKDGIGCLVELDEIGRAHV